MRISSSDSFFLSGIDYKLSKDRDCTSAGCEAGGRSVGCGADDVCPMLEATRRDL